MSSHNSQDAFVIPERVQTIGTHDSNFHADDVIGCCILSTIYPDAQVVRSRDPDVLKTCDIVLDVGGEFSPERYRFDHHQAGFAEYFFSDASSILSASGLIYKYFGKKYIEMLCGPIDAETMNFFFNFMYYTFFECVDCIDNGVSPSKDQDAAFHPFSPDSYVLLCNRSRNPFLNTHDLRFSAVFYRMREFLKTLILENHAVARNHTKIEQIVKSQREMQEEHKIYAPGLVVCLSENIKYENLIYIENKLGKKIYYMLLKRAAKDSQRYVLYTVPQSMRNMYKPKTKIMPELQEYINTADINKLLGVTDIVYLSRTGHLLVTETVETAVRVAIRSLETIGEHVEHLVPQDCAESR